MRLKHQRDEGSSGRQKKARISFEHLFMDKDIYLQVELEVYLCSHHYIKKMGTKPERVSDSLRAHASSFCLAAVMTYICSDV